MSKNRSARRFKVKSLWLIIAALSVLISMGAALSILFVMNARYSEAVDSAAFWNHSRVELSLADTIGSFVMDTSKTARMIAELREAQVFLLDDDIDTIAVFDDEGTLLYKADSREFYPGFNPTVQSWFRAVAPGSRFFSLSEPHSQKLYAGEERQVISMSAGLSLESDGRRRRGVLLVDIDMSAISDFCDNMMSDRTYFYIVNERGNVIYLPDMKKSYENEPGTTEFLDEGGRIITEGDKRLFISAAVVDYTNWRIVGVSTLESVFLYNRDMSVFVVIIMLSTFFIVAVLAFITSFTVTRPLRLLTQHMEDIQPNIREVSVRANGIYEVISLQESFNDMARRVKLLMERTVSDQKALRESELRALYAQINPHFIYNTLDSMIWLAESGRRAKVVKMIEALANFFRLTLNRSRDDISVWEEIKHVESYMLIQKMRLGDGFDYKISADEDVKNLMSMKIVLQPFAENAVVHGIGSSIDGDDGVVIIRAYRDGGDLIYEIADNGVGMEPEALERLSDMNKPYVTGIGIRNTCERIKLKYGDRYGATFKSEPDEGTTVTIRLPINPGEGGTA